jgi:hypothetical protein
MFLRALRLAPVFVAFLATVAHADEPLRTSFFLGAGPTGSEALGFDRAWGIAAGLELPVARVASFLARVDYNSIPNGSGEFVAFPAQILNSLLDGSSDSGPKATLASVMMGLRLHSPARPIQGYADALVGVGHYSPPELAVMPAYAPAPPPPGKATNVALSFGLGVRLLSTRVGSLFADAHYDFYFAEGAPSPVVPIKLGFALP